MITWVLLVIMWNADAGALVGTEIKAFNDLPRCLAAASSERMQSEDPLAQFVCWPDMAPVKPSAPRAK